MSEIDLEGATQDEILAQSKVSVLLGICEGGKFKQLLRWPPHASSPSVGDRVELALRSRKDSGWYKVKDIVWKTIIDNDRKAACLYGATCFVILEGTG